MGLFSSLEVYGGAYNVTLREELSDSEKKAIGSAYVKESEKGYGPCICMVLKTGKQKFLPVSRDCDLVVGNNVDIDSLVILKLERAGDKPIYKGEGTAIE